MSKVDLGKAGLDLPQDLSDNSAWVGHIPFAMWLVDLIKPGIIVELGTHCGDSFFAFCQSAKQYSPDSRLFAVDTWEGDKHAGFYASDIFDRVKNINGAKYKDNSVLLRKTFDQALEDVDDNSVDLLHIDGLHTYEAVKHDFESWYPKLSDSAVVLFHDTVVKKDDFGVHKFWDEIKVKYPSMNFIHSNGLGVLITGGSLNKPVTYFCKRVTCESFRTSARDLFSALGEKCEFFKTMHLLDQAIGHSQHLQTDIDALKEYTKHLETDISATKTRYGDIERSHKEYAKNLESDKDVLKEYAKHLETDISTIKTRYGDLECSHKKNTDKLFLTEKELIRLKDEIIRIHATKVWRYSAVLRTIRGFLSGNGSLGLMTKLKKSPVGRLIYRLSMHYKHLKTKIRELPYSGSNNWVMNGLAEKRSTALLDKKTGPSIDYSGEIDLTAVVYNNSQWLDQFIKSLILQKFPSHQINLFFVNNGSTDQSLGVLKSLQSKYQGQFKQFSISENKNIGFGAGHDRAVRSGHSSFVLIANIDMEFEKDAIANVVEYAVGDSEDTASWEFRQKPYEHPKYYDPITLETTWSSHACILVRRSAYEQVGGYEKKIFMYGEDVELSYRFRDNGFRIKYFPGAVVYHYTYESAGQVKPAQFIGSTLANALIRFRYGSVYDKSVVFPMQWAVVIRGGGFKGSRLMALKNQVNIIGKLPFFWRNRANTKFPFHGFDYEKIRDGSFYTPKQYPKNKPLVSIITRTYKGRERLLQECMASVMNQTYSMIEHLIVEDGGDTMTPLINKVNSLYPKRQIVYQALPKNGRSYAGNQGMEMAAGKYLLFLDDDDLLFADHVETLVSEIEADESLGAVYSLAWEIETSFDSKGDYYEHAHGTDALFFQEFDRTLLMHHNYIPIQSILFQKALYQTYGGFDLDMDCLEDWNLWSRYALNSQFKFIPKTTSLYRTPHEMKVRLNRKKVFDQVYADAVARQMRDIEKFGIK